jgi:large repetitive protein
VYPLFFCRGQTPTSEPTCVPYRKSYPSGITSSDRDGDGVPDSIDDCPSIFNPPRLLDNDDDPEGGLPTAQSDVNGNGVGDVCDPHPL